MIRNAVGMSQEAFAKTIGASKRTLEGIEQTGRAPRFEVVEKILGLWPEYTMWLMRGTVIPEAGQISPEIEETRRNSLREGKGT